MGASILTAAGDGYGAGNPRFSIVAPLRDEAPNVELLVDEIAEVLASRRPFEVVLVDDGSRDGTGDAIQAAMARHPFVRGLKHETSCGQSAAQRTGILAARAPLIVTIDGDGQNDPADIPLLLDRMAARPPGSRLAMVAGQRRRREDDTLRRFSSGVANRIRRGLLKDGCRDIGCGLKAFDRAAYLSLPYFDNAHRFYPALMRREGYEVELVDVGHRRRWKGDSKYGVLNRLGAGIVDLLGAWWLTRRRRLPQSSEYSK